MCNFLENLIIGSKYYLKIAIVCFWRKQTRKSSKIIIYIPISTVKFYFMYLHFYVNYFWKIKNCFLNLSAFVDELYWVFLFVLLSKIYHTTTTKHTCSRYFNKMFILDWLLSLISSHKECKWSNLFNANDYRWIVINSHHWRIQWSEGCWGCALPLLVQFISFSCSFRQKSCKIIGCFSLLRGLRPTHLHFCWRVEK